MPNDEFGQAFEYKPAIDALRKKTAFPTTSYRDLRGEMNAHAFMVAGAAQIDIVSDFQQAVTSAITQGQSLQDFQKSFDRIVAQYGWSYNGSRGWRSALIYNVNLRSSYAAGQWGQYQETKEDLPNLKYLTAGDDAVRDSHEELSGAIYPIDDPFWKFNYPPNGYQCRCGTIAVSDEDAGDKIRRTPDGEEPAKLGASEGFDYNVGIAGSSTGPSVGLGSKILGLPKDARDAVLNRANAFAPDVLTPAFTSMVDRDFRTTTQRDALSNSGRTVPIGFLPPTVINHLDNINKSATTAVILAQDVKITPSIRSLKKSTVKISDGFIKNLPKHIANPEKVLYDTGKGDVLFLMSLPGEKTNKLLAGININASLEGSSVFANIFGSLKVVLEKDFDKNNYHEITAE